MACFSEFFYSKTTILRVAIFCSLCLDTKKAYREDISTGLCNLFGVKNFPRKEYLQVLRLQLVVELLVAETADQGQVAETAVAELLLAVGTVVQGLQAVGIAVQEPQAVGTVEQEMAAGIVAEQGQAAGIVAEQEQVADTVAEQVRVADIAADQAAAVAVHHPVSVARYLLPSCECHRIGLLHGVHSYLD